MSPIGLVIIGVTALGVAIAYQTGAIGIALEWMASKWQELLNFVMPIIEGIKNALVQGKWAEAGQIAMLGLQVAFRAGLEPIYGLWTDLQTWLISGTVGLVTNMANVFAGIPTALMNGFATAITWLTGTWDQTVNYIAKKLLYLYSLFDSSVNYEQAAAQMDKEATQRAGKRQKELDAATAKRNQALQDANQGRLQFAEDLTRNVRQDAAQRKRDFATKNASLREEMRGLINSVNATAEGSSTAAAPLDEAKKVTQQAVAQLPTSQPTTASPAGTFSGFTAGMLGAQSPLVKLADMSKKSLDTLIKIEGNTRDNADLVLE
jgi:Tfp pilus assembly protein PilO